MPIGAAALIPMLMGGLGAAGGALSSKQKQQQDQTSKSTSTENTNSTGTTTKNLLPEQQQALAKLMPYIGQLLGGNNAGLDPLKEFTRSKVNSNYGQFEDALRTKLGRGGGRSGKMGTATRAMELSRLGQLSGVDADFAKMMLDEQNKGANLGMGLLGMNFGQTATQQGTGTRTTEGSSSTTGTTSQNPWGAALGGGVGGALGGASLYDFGQEKEWWK
jgi:hypothetical protein